MQCPNCQAELRDGAAFCGSCGASIPAQGGVPVSVAPAPPAVPVPPAAPTPTVAPTAVMPPVVPQSAAQQPGYDPTAYAQQPGAAPAPQGPQKKSKTGCIIAVIAGILFLCLACGIGGVVAFRAASDAGVIEPGDVLVPGTEEPTGEEAPVGGFPTAEDAVIAELQDAGYGDWVYQLYDETEDRATYWAGPPASEWVSEIIVVRGSDGTWTVESADAIEAQGGDVAISDEAAAVVDEHLRAVGEDRGLDAQSYTIDPFRADPASAQVSAGGFESYEITGATEQSDLTVWVQTVQVWYGESQNWEYYVVPTEEGYKISDVRPY